LLDVSKNGCLLSDQNGLLCSEFHTWEIIRFKWSTQLSSHPVNEFRL
jgi:hypothetical protein